MTVIIKTSNVPRQTIYGYELPENIKKDFDHIEDLSWSDFILYKGNYYHTNDFISTYAFNGDGSFHGQKWDGYTVDSAFNGIVVRRCEDDQDCWVVGSWFDVSN
jgi:hypothetical protein